MVVVGALTLVAFGTGLLRGWIQLRHAMVYWLAASGRSGMMVKIEYDRSMEYR